jgi:hypothetical protein
MARRITGGLAGSSSLLGTIQISPNAAMATAADQDITFSPGGTGQVISTANLQLNAQNDLRFADADSSNWVAFQAPATVSSNITWTLPAIDGTNNQVLTTNGSGTLAWSSKDVALEDQTTSSSTHYVTLTTATSGVATTLNVSSTKLTFQPSTGVLTLTGISGYSGAVAIVADDTTNATRFPIFVNSATGNQTPATDNGYTYNPSTGTLTAVIVTASSDERLKENIATISNALDKVLKMRGVSYNRIGSTRTEIGLIAQELEKIAPELVTTDENGMKSVAYGNTIGLLIESIKDQQQQIDELKKRSV